MEENNEDQQLPAKATDEDIRRQISVVENSDNGEPELDTFVYLQSSSVISILIVVIITLVCILATSLLIKTVIQSRGITRTLSIYFGFQPNRTIDESILTFWAPKSIYNEQPIETDDTITTTAIISSSLPLPPPVLLSQTEKKAQTTFRTIIVPSLLLLSIFCGILAFYMRLHNNYYPAWGARPKRPEQFVTIELKQPQTAETNVLI
jgi:hypothetical protein